MWDEPATGPQLHQIARLSQLAGINHPTEEYPMTRDQARKEIFALRVRLKGTKRREYGKGDLHSYDSSRYQRQ